MSHVRAAATALAGAATAVACAATTLLGVLFVVRPSAAWFNVEMGLAILTGLGMTVGPGSFLIGLAHCRWLGRKAEDGAPAGTVLCLGILAGALLGFLNVLAAGAIVTAWRGGELGASLGKPMMLAMAGLLGVSSGAPLGWLCAWSVLRRVDPERRRSREGSAGGLTTPGPPS